MKTEDGIASTKAEQDIIRKLLARQRKQVKPAKDIKLKCGDCGRITSILYVYCCLYCSVRFCKRCAKKHFNIVDKGTIR